MFIDDENEVNSEDIEVSNNPFDEKDSVNQEDTGCDKKDSNIDDEEEIDFDCYGVNKEKFKVYVKTLQDAGYEVKDIEESYSSYYDSIETSDGYELTLDCDYEEEILSIDLSKK